MMAPNLVEDVSKVWQYSVRLSAKSVLQSGLRGWL